ncbi:MAG: hypothetical protein ACRDTA_12370 [Pseudonocardiaceae bacterium]
MDRPSWVSGGFAVDRRMPRRAIELWPELPLIMQADRAFLRRSVRAEARVSTRW